MPQLSAQLVSERYWELGRGGKSRLVTLGGRLADVKIYVVQFMLDGTPLSGTALWNRAPQLIAPAVAQCLRNLKQTSDALIVSVRSGPDYLRRVGKQRLHLNAEEVIYLDYIATRKVRNFWWLTFQTNDVWESELLFEPPDESIDLITDTFWEWNSFRGYVVPATNLLEVNRWLTSYRKESWKARRFRELETASVFFEDWADGSALRLWTKRFTEGELLAQLKLSEVNEALARIQVDEKTKRN